MPFSLCNALATFQRCMLSIFSNLIEHDINIFIDNFSIYGITFDSYLKYLIIVLKRCVEINLVLN
ncbi:hypothetical protein MA16_Dca025646 [Dendrobium catenatum]|uniref:Reverse transcriptase domain-containing protein n=1 Tax=Dendrobium catenatum TaxID=906689 RepID=A0A2I0VC60_9ASPA|nr:hypothetical protein MA16_Dca025646 [Dendrobium catenatum]